MVATFVHSVSSEWLKQKRSLTSWLIFGGAFFVPTIIFLSRFRHIPALPAMYEAPLFWEGLWRQSWESMVFMILPMAIMLMASLLAQLEYRNNAWKQVHASPQPLATIFLAKLVVLLVLLILLMFWFNVAVYLAGVLPVILFSNVHAPASPLPLTHFLKRDLALLIDVLPIVALQYMLALRFRSFLAPLGIGMALWILSVGTMGWTYNYVVPYSYAGIDYLMVEYARKQAIPVRPGVIAAACFLVFTGVGYVVYAWKADKG
jgi:lantibiotic transport system permease protein